MAAATNGAPSASRKLTQSGWFWTAVAIVGVVAAAYIVVPPLVLNFANRKLANMKKYSGHIAGIDLSLLHGGVVAKDLKLWQRDAGSIDRPLASARAVRVHWIWHDLLHGRQLFDVTMVDPHVRIVNQAQKEEAKHGNKSLQDELRGAFGDKLKALHIQDGDVVLEAQAGDQPVRLTLHDLNGDAIGLQDHAGPKHPRPAHIDLRGKSTPPGSFHVRAHFNPKDPVQAFQMLARVQTKDLEDWNKLLAKAADLKVKSGEMTLDVDLSGDDGKLDGAVRPYLKDLEIADFQGDHSALVAKIKNTLLGAAADILENGDTHVIAARAPIHGDLNQPGTSVWSTVWSGVEHAFAQSATGRKEALHVQPAAPSKEPPPQPAHRQH
jgi:hypothetical protein